MVDPYCLLAEFRLTYSVKGDEPVDEDDVKQFVHWNALFNAWPYWRARERYWDHYVEELNPRMTHWNQFALTGLRRAPAGDAPRAESSAPCAEGRNGGTPAR